MCHLTDEKIEAQRSRVIYPMLHSEVEAKLGLAPQIPDSKFIHCFFYYIT